MSETYEMVLPVRNGRRKYKVGSMEVTFNQETERIQKWKCVLIQGGYAAFERYEAEAAEQ